MKILGWHAMGLSKFADGETPVIGNLGGDISDESCITDSPFAVKILWLAVGFPSLTFLIISYCCVFFKALSL
jgi:hypothetical protein